MAHFAELDQNNIVVRVIVVGNDDIIENGLEKEDKGITFCQNLLGQNTTWVQTSYNGNFRKKFAGIGDYYDSQKNKFISPQPYPSWSLNNDDDWAAPISHPEDGQRYRWNESLQQWEGE